MSKKFKLSDCTPDENNFNKHTQRGMGLLEKSIESVGVIESVTVSADNKVISGNARQEVLTQKFENVLPIIIESDGTRPIILKRTDIVSGTKQFHKAALLANTVSKHNINLDLEKIQEIAIDEFGIDVEELGVEGIPSISDVESNGDNPYTKKVEAPIYEMNGEKPELNQLFDITRYSELIDSIKSIKLNPELEKFLTIAASRHIVFNYQKIAEFYAQSKKEVQELMEDSALVVIDFDKAIENGYIELSEKIENEYKS